MKKKLLEMKLPPFCRGGNINNWNNYQLFTATLKITFTKEEKNAL